MSYQEKTVAVSLVTFTLILGFYGIRVLQMVQTGDFNSSNVFRLWGITIALAIVATILLTILTHIFSAIIHAIQTGQEKPEIEDIQDERDQIIDLRGTKVTYFVSSIGSLFAMLTFVFGQSPLVMFTLLVVSGLIAQIIGDVARLYLYRRGF
jgi:hypothetical protein